MLNVERSRLVVPMKQVLITQNSPEWRDWRFKGFGGSDAPIIMGVSPWSNPYKLWEVRTGRRPEQKDTFYMARGKRLEEEARQAYERDTGELVTPMCGEHGFYPWMKVSLDGINFNGNVVAEIKVPGKIDHELALKGIVPPKYYPQLQHQMMVAGPDVKFAHYYSYDPDSHTGTLVVVARDDDYILDMAQTEAKLWECVLKNTPPVADETRHRAETWRLVKQRLEQAKAEEQEVRALLLQVSGIDSSVPISRDLGLLTVSVSEAKGKVNYDRLLADKGIILTPQELDQYREPSSMQTKLLVNRHRQLERQESSTGETKVVSSSTAVPPAPSADATFAIPPTSGEELLLW